MLILDRRIGERLMIGDEVVVTVVGVNGCQVRLGIEAPRHVPVHREEIYHRIHGEGGYEREPTTPQTAISASTPAPEIDAPQPAEMIPVTRRGRRTRSPQ